VNYLLSSLLRVRFRGDVSTRVGIAIETRIVAAADLESQAMTAAE
jgi:hypothetical protein